jgi:ketosteroid isomerase-like protein
VASGNVELVRSIYATWERGDFSTVTAWVHPEIELVVPDGPEPGRWNGLAGLAEAWRRWTDAWTDFRAEVEEVLELDDERVLVLIGRSGRGKGSGLELDQIGTRGVVVYHFRDGKVVKIVNYFDHDRALVDLGLVRESE